MKRTIKLLRGFHYPILNFPFRVFCRLKAVVKYDIMFDYSCRYDLQSIDQYDWNKLFGLQFGLFGIHKNSFRFAWRYNAATDKIEIAKYEYVNGSRRYETLFILPLNVFHSLSLELECYPHYTKVCYHIMDDTLSISSYEVNFNKPIYTSGFYFGGNRKAPHDIIIKIKK